MLKERLLQGLEPNKLSTEYWKPGYLRHGTRTLKTSHWTAFKNMLQDSDDPRQIDVAERTLRQHFDKICSIWVWVFLLMTAESNLSCKSCTWSTSLAPSSNLLAVAMFDRILSLRCWDGDSNGPATPFSHPRHPELTEAWSSPTKADQNHQRLAINYAELVAGWHYVGSQPTQYNWSTLVRHISTFAQGGEEILHRLRMAWLPREEQERSSDSTGLTITECLYGPDEQQGDTIHGWDVLHTIMPVGKSLDSTAMASSILL